MEIKKENLKTNKKKPFLFKLTAGIIRIFYRKRKFVGVENLPDEPALIIGNHAQLHGPLACQLFFPTYKYIWCIGQMTVTKEVPAYAYQDFWSMKPKWIRWFFKIVSYLIAPICGYLFSRADVIPVYKDKRLIKTFNLSMEKVNDGANVIIFPECLEPYNEIVNDFQDKFIDTARFYYRKYKKELYFVPMYNAVRLKTIVFGKPIKYDANLEIELQREKICQYLKDEITRLAKELPRHKVVPYANVGRKKYPYSK